MGDLQAIVRHPPRFRRASVQPSSGDAALFAFPGARHDDRVDLISQALDEKNVRFPLVITQEMADQFRRLPLANRRNRWF